MFITKDQLNLAGWLSITSAIFTVPHIAMSIYFERIGGPGAKLSQAIMTVVALGLMIYILLSFRKLLNTRFQFHGVDITISLLILGNVILSILSFLSLWSRRLEILVGTLSIAAFIPFGILAIIFATRLLRIPDRLYGLLKPFSYTLMVTGVCFITVFLSPVGYIASAVSDVILGIIFFRAAEHPPSATELLNMPIE